MPTEPSRALDVSLRTILRIVDGLFIYLVGLIVALLSGERRQRFGDMAGKTQVVKKVR